MPQCQSVMNRMKEESSKYNRIYVSSIHKDFIVNDVRTSVSSSALNLHCLMLMFFCIWNILIVNQHPTCQNVENFTYLLYLTFLITWLSATTEILVFNWPTGYADWDGLDTFWEWTTPDRLACQATHWELHSYQRTPGWPKKLESWGYPTVKTAWL